MADKTVTIADLRSLDQVLVMLETITKELIQDGHDLDIDQVVDVCALPTFGGTPPSNTHQVWSWDERRVLVAVGSDWTIEDRCACGEASFHCVCAQEATMTELPLTTTANPGATLEIFVPRGTPQWYNTVDRSTLIQWGRSLGYQGMGEVGGELLYIPLTEPDNFEAAMLRIPSQARVQYLVCGRRPIRL